jgi:tetratricopeptide (TPR) repeat protein
MENDSEQLVALEKQFLIAVGLRNDGQIDRAVKQFKAILTIEPRLAEPHIELAHICVDTDRLDRAESHALEAIEQLEQSGVWLDSVPENTVKAVAHALLAEILRRRADEDDVIFGDPAEFLKMVELSKEHFKIAAALDPDDTTASYYAFFMGVDDVKLPT